MRAKELLMLGSTLMKAVPGTRYMFERGGGCALGMMSAAKGDVLTAIESFHGFEWMGTTLVKVPCGCGDNKGTYTTSIVGAVAHIFDSHVIGDHTRTLEQLADWLDIYEPITYQKMLPAAPIEVETEDVYLDAQVCAV